MKALYICGDDIGRDTGAGAVTAHELQALRSVFGPDNVHVLERKDLVHHCYNGLDIPFLWDYLATQQVTTWVNASRDSHYYTHAHFYSGSFTNTIRYLKGLGVTVTQTSPAHNAHLSRQERRDNPGHYLPHIDEDDLLQLHNEGLRLADLVIVPSNHSKEYLGSERVRNLTIIPHGTDPVTEFIWPLPEHFTLGYLGGIGPDKGLKYLFQAWGQLNLPDAELVVGGSESLALENFIRRHAPQGRFRLLGWVEEKYRFYNTISAYCQPSVTEGFGIEVLEALAYGRPVLASTGCGASDVLDPHHRFQVRDKDALGVLLLDLYQRYPSVRALDARHQDRQMNMHRERALPYYWDRIEARYVEVFRQFACRG